MNYLEKRQCTLMESGSVLASDSATSHDYVVIPRIDEVLRRTSEGMPAPKGVPGEPMYDTAEDGDNVDPANSYGFDRFDYVDMQRDAARQKYIQKRQSKSDPAPASVDPTPAVPPTPPSE